MGKKLSKSVSHISCPQEATAPGKLSSPCPEEEGHLSKSFCRVFQRNREYTELPLIIMNSHILFLLPSYGCAWFYRCFFFQTFSRKKLFLYQNMPEMSSLTQHQQEANFVLSEEVQLKINRYCMQSSQKEVRLSL